MQLLLRLLIKLTYSSLFLHHGIISRVLLEALPNPRAPTRSNIQQTSLTLLSTCQKPINIAGLAPIQQHQGIINAEVKACAAFQAEIGSIQE